MISSSFQSHNRAAIANNLNKLNRAFLRGPWSVLGTHYRRAADDRDAIHDGQVCDRPYRWQRCGEYADLQVTYAVNEPFNATAPASTLAFSGVEKTRQAMQPGAGYALTITGAQSHWHASTAQSWIKLTATSGAGAATVVAAADGTTLSSGSYSGTVTVSDDVSGAVFNFPVTLVLHAPALVVTPATLTFSIDSLTPSSDLTQTLSITDELGGAQPNQAAQWSLASITAPLPRTWACRTRQGSSSSAAPISPFRPERSR